LLEASSDPSGIAESVSVVPASEGTIMVTASEQLQRRATDVAARKEGKRREIIPGLDDTLRRLRIDGDSVWRGHASIGVSSEACPPFSFGGA
jgi:hypothetical protein